MIGVPKTIDNDLGGDRRHVRIRHRAARRHRGDRPPAHDRREPQPDPGRRGDGPQRRVDRAALRDRRRRRRDPDPGDPVRHRGGVPADPPPPRARALLLDRGRGRGRDAQGGDDGRCRQRRAWTSSAIPRLGRDRLRARAGDRAAHRLRDPRHGARPRPARRHADGRSIACSPRGSGWRRSTPPTTARGE